MDSGCPRCGAALTAADNTFPLFCAHCGLPQLRVSTDAISVAGAGNGRDEANPRPVSDATLDLPRALRVVAIAGLAGVLPASLLPGALVSGEVGGLALLLMPVLVFGAMLAYGRGRLYGGASSAEGTRIGALLGLWMGCLIAAVTGAAGFVLRYRYHSHAIDEKIEQAAAQMPTQLRGIGAVQPEVMAFLQTPEFRAGSFIFGHVFTLLLLVCVGSICGWMAAAMLRTRRRPSAG